ncbi:sensor histidine kinase [Granulosicoccus antarcticus]|uniref:histidine kinase n=1 Tax=Granulosicoccus antarcticus IMCC3135 TaxID=1192854 RepID=A0A2Z2NS83_9GAMM|nr:ATP-binding protein [Granulosicoccus antarcticus]ASJ72861.1 Sensor protein ZraS [Granulosicoccus antarcticus IMCC3135]
MSLKFKTVIGIALIEAVLLAYLILTVLGFMNDSAGDALLKRAHTTATLFATTTKDPVLSYDLASLEAFSEELMVNPDIEYVRVLDASGLVFSELGNVIFLERDFQEDLSLESVDDHVFDTSAEISENGISYGSVQLGINTDNIQETINASRRQSLIIAAVEMTLVALFSLLLGTYLTQQLKVLQKSAKMISSGDYSVQIEITSNDEVSDVAKAFNQMSEALSLSEKSRNEKDALLQELNRTLEQRVERRTEKINAQIHQLSAANDQVAQTQARLVQSEKLASVGQLAAGVAHEINNPIGFVRSNLNTLSEYVGVYQNLLHNYKKLSTADADQAILIAAEIEQQEKKEDIAFINDDIEELLKDSIDGTTRVRDIVHGLKNFSRTNTENKVDCDTNEIISTVLKIVNNELKYKCNVHTELLSRSLVRGNTGELNQVFLNLLMNAGQAIEEGGTVSISTDDIDDKIRIRVTDDGYGIKPEDIEKLFDPFFTTKPVGEGTGLGLSISFGIVEDHGGEILVSSEEGKGTTFTILLPVSS